MTEPACRVVEVQPIGPHPLARRDGIHALAAILAARSHWRPLTARQKTALQAAYDHALATAGVGERVPLPALPADTHPATVRALARRGLAADGAMTGLAVEVVRWAGARRERPVTDADVTGERL